MKHNVKQGLSPLIKLGLWNLKSLSEDCHTDKMLYYKNCNTLWVSLVQKNDHQTLNREEFATQPGGVYDDSFFYYKVQKPKRDY